jgi:hypothetical protein
MWICIINVVSRPKWLEGSSHSFAARLDQVEKPRIRGDRNVILEYSNRLNL